MRKRRHKRIIKRLETEFSANGLTFRGTSSDLSRSGLFVRTSKPFPQDTLVDLTVHLPGDIVSRLKGSVRWTIRTGQTTIKNGMGMEIVEADHNYINFLNTILPAEEQVHRTEQNNSEVALPVTKGVPVASPKTVQDARPVARQDAGLKTGQDASPTTGQDSKDESIDSMISALFTKRDNK